MIKIIFLSFLIVLSSCSTAPKGSERDQDDEFSSLKDEDFNSVEEVRYQIDQDFYSKDVKDSILARESLNTLLDDEIEDFKDSKDPLSQVAALCYLKKFDEGFSILSKTYRQYKNHPGYWNLVGNCYYIKGEHRKAILYYHKSRSKDKRYIPAVNNLGVIYMKEAKFQEALEAFKMAAKINPDLFTPQFNLMNLYLRFGLITKAKGLLRKLNVFAENDVELINAQATILLIEGKPKESTELFSSIHKKYLWRADISLNYATALHLMGQTKPALEIFKKIDRSRLGQLDLYYRKVLEKLGG